MKRTILLTLVFLCACNSEIRKKEPKTLLSNQESTADKLFSERHYQEALNMYDQLLINAKSPEKLFYRKAQCHLHLGKIAEAVADLRLLVLKNDSIARRLNDSINPIKKRRAGAVIRCMDGTISHSKQRNGTCSHHGGVKDWAQPVYETYREYK